MTGKGEKPEIDGKKSRSDKRRARIPDLIFGVVLTLLVLTALYFLFASGDDEDKPSSSENRNDVDDDNVGTAIGMTAPDFTLTDTDGIKFSLSDYRGKIVLLDFMATWCGPCVTEMDHLKEVKGNYFDKEVRIISIDVDDAETSKELRDFGTEHECNWRFTAGGGSVGNTYGAASIPTLYLVDEQGTVSYKATGVTDYSVLSSELDELV